MSSIMIIETLYRAFKNEDYDLFREVSDDDLEWIQNKGFPHGGHHHGPEAVIQNVFKRYDDDWEYFKFSIEDMWESKDGSRVFVTGTYVGKHRRTGKKIEASAAHVYKIENRKVKQFRQFADTAVIVSAIES